MSVVDILKAIKRKLIPIKVLLSAYIRYTFPVHLFWYCYCIMEADGKVNVLPEYGRGSIYEELFNMVYLVKIKGFYHFVSNYFRNNTLSAKYFLYSKNGGLLPRSMRIQ